MMSGFRRFLRSPVTTVVLFAAAAGLLLTGTIGGVRAAPLLESGAFAAQVELGNNIEAAITENGGIAGESLLGGFTAESPLRIGQLYDEALAVTNTGDMDEYVRVSVYRFWTDANGSKLTTLTPDMIDLHFLTSGSGWVIDDDASTAERVTLYYTRPLAPGETTPAFTDTLFIDGSVLTEVSSQTTDGVIVMSYNYSDVSCNLKAEVNGVQTHNAEAAILSAWGRAVTVDDSGVLSLG